MCVVLMENIICFQFPEFDDIYFQYSFVYGQDWVITSVSICGFIYTCDRLTIMPFNCSSFGLCCVGSFTEHFNIFRGNRKPLSASLKCGSYLPRPPSNSNRDCKGHFYFLTVYLTKHFLKLEKITYNNSLRVKVLERDFVH